MSVALDIIICTYNREEILRDCLSSLASQVTRFNNWGLIIVNNYSTSFDPMTIEVISQIKNIQVTIEQQPGLSHARNTGIRLSNATWLGFLDDDARVPPDYIENAMNIIIENEFDSFGGHIQSWWKYGRPRWLDQTFGSKPILKEKRGLIKDGYNWGSNIFIKKEALEFVGGFPNQIGMKGRQLGYAAENIVQIKLRQHDYKIGYDPDFHIDHLVMPVKLKLWWHIKATFAEGRDGKNVFRDQYRFMGFIISLKNCLSRPTKALWKWVTVKEFYWENFFLESGKPIALFCGKVVSIIS